MAIRQPGSSNPGAVARPNVGVAWWACEGGSNIQCFELFWGKQPKK